ncbi:MAG: cation diffusion facilitator family transporter [Proteobacteria bacterium]|nr:cation diffusion facilitator family transporter [Pseudomonadota bacterium]
MTFPVLTLNQIAIGNLLISLIVLGVKYIAFELTGSIALYSDALESTVNVATAIAAIVAIRLAARPPDAEHPYGHHKVEYMSAVLVGALIIVAALIILREAYHGFLQPKVLDAPFSGLMVSAGATALNGIWSQVLIKQGRLKRSAALVADGKHLFTDVVSSLGVLVGVLLVVFTHNPRLDSVLAALVAMNVLWSGWGVIRENVSGLMDEAAPPEELGRIREIISTNATGSLEAHALRTRHAGKVIFVDFHLVVVASMTVGEAHDICDRIEEALKAEFPNMSISIHVEPEYKAKHKGIVIL